MKRILLSSFLTFGLFVNAQIDVTATAGTPVASYTTLKSAFDAINSGFHQGDIRLNVSANTTESASAVLNAATTYSSVLIKPSTSVVVSGAIASGPLVKILGSNVTIDGSAVAGGTTKDLTFTNTSLVDSSVFFMGSPNLGTPLTNVTVKNSAFVNGTNDSTNFVISNGATTAGYFNNVTVQNNDIKTGFNGIFVVAGPGATNGNNLIINGNKVDGIVQNGILLSGVGGASTVSANVINNSNPTIGITTAPAGSIGINILSGTNNASVFGNKISVKSTAASGVNYSNGINVAPGAANVSTKIYNNTISEISGFLSYLNSSAIYVNGVTSNVSIYSNKISGIKNTNAAVSVQGLALSSSSLASNVLVYNNVLSDIVSTGAGNSFGVYVVSGAGYKLYNNTVNLNTSNGETGVSAAFAVNTNGVTTPNALDIRNNIFANSKPGSLSLAIYAFSNNISAFGNLDYNNYYTSGSFIGFNGALSATLADIKSAFGGNVNSLVLKPDFVSLTDMHLKTDANQGLDNKGVSLPEVSTDFDGAARGVAPDMGAYEFSYITLAASDVNKTNVSVYPNPFRDVLRISDVKDAKSINVADASGRVVATPKVSQELNLSSLSKGVYFVTVSYENGSAKSFKVIKE